MKINKNFSILIIFLLIFNYSCINNKKSSELQLQEKLYKEQLQALDSIRNEISELKEKIECYKKLLLPYTVKTPLGLVVCLSDPSHYSYLSFYNNSYMEDYYSGASGKIIKGTWSFENDTIYYDSPDYFKPQKISFKDLLHESQSLTYDFNYCIVDKMPNDALDKE